MIKNVQGIILAAGKSTRFNTEKSKLAATICGQAMILFPTKLLQSLNIPTTIVVGHQQATIKDIVSAEHNNTVNFVTQDTQNGTGHALAITKDLWQHEHILVINGDMPLITQEIILALYQKHLNDNATISFVTACDPDLPIDNAYGKVIQKANSIEIIEAKDLPHDLDEFCCINAGIYLIKKDFLYNYISTLNNNNISKEFYITDLIKIASTYQLIVTTLDVPFNIIQGINTLEELSTVEHIQRRTLITYWTNNGVRFSFPDNTHLDLNVTIGQGTSIASSVHLRGNTTIGKQCTIAEFSSLDNVILEDNVTIHSHSVLRNSLIQSNAEVGPFAYIRSNSSLGQNSIIGNFVEVKNSTIGTNTKAKHLTYIGDATIGSQVNIGAGTITCNYNGISKNKTIINDNAFIGSNNTLIAPVTIGNNAFTAAGSTITADVPDNALAIARSHQTNKYNYAHKLRTKKTTVENDTPENNFSFTGARIIHHNTPADDL